jgi:hypothetical protein
MFGKAGGLGLCFGAAKQKTVGHIIAASDGKVLLGQGFSPAEDL